MGSSGPGRVRVERGIYRQPNGKYAVCWRHAGRLRFRTVGFDLAEARRERLALIAATREGSVPVSPRLCFETAVGWWLERFEARVAAGEQWGRNRSSDPGRRSAVGPGDREWQRLGRTLGGRDRDPDRRSLREGTRPANHRRDERTEHRDRGRRRGGLGGAPGRRQRHAHLAVATSLRREAEMKKTTRILAIAVVVALGGNTPATAHPSHTSCKTFGTGTGDVARGGTPPGRALERLNSWRRSTRTSASRRHTGIPRGRAGGRLDEGATSSDTRPRRA
jgi:hypothetical protein